MFIDFGTWTRLIGEARRYDAATDFGDTGDKWADRVFIAASMRPVGAENGQVKLECRYYDRDHAACRAYDRRPPMCSGYPWYGQEPTGRAFGPHSRCSYQLDLPASGRPPGARPLIPLTVLRRG